MHYIDCKIFAYIISIFFRARYSGQPQAPRCLDSDANIRLACPRFHCSCFMKRPLELRPQLGPMLSAYLLLALSAVLRSFFSASNASRLTDWYQTPAARASMDDGSPASVDDGYRSPSKRAWTACITKKQSLLPRVDLDDGDDFRARCW